MYDRLTGEIFTVLDAQTVVVVCTNAVELVLLQLAGMPADLRTWRRTGQDQVEAVGKAHPLHQVLSSILTVSIKSEPRSSPRSSARTSPPPGTWAPTSNIPR